MGDLKRNEQVEMHLIFTETGFIFLPGWLGLSPLSPPGYSHIRGVHAALQGREAGKRSSLVFSHSVQAACTLARCVDEEKTAKPAQMCSEQHSQSLSVNTNLQGDIS